MMIDDIEDEELDDKEEISDYKFRDIILPVLSEDRHLEKIERYKCESHCWRLKDRMKTVSVAIALCLNIPVDPPDVVKLQPCARVEAWIDPINLPQPKAIDAIGENLQKAYERWQPKARYKIAKDPTVDSVKKLCISLRKNAKEERVLFHYNGHGVPRPTDNGEIWVFNSNYTQYIPLSIYDLQQWMGTPSIYVYDCSHAGKIVKLFRSFSKIPDDSKCYECIHFAACGEKQMLPMNPDLPADVFTACLTTPIKMGIKFYFLQHKKRFLPQLTPEMLDKIPGQLNDRRSMIGELNWIFTAVTDTIAWNILPRDQFQKLFRQDLLVASLFRNFILADRILRFYDCIPISSPALPPVSHLHHMWSAWDLALESSLSQLPNLLLSAEKTTIEKPLDYVTSSFFDNQLTAFDKWLDHGSVYRAPPEQLPIVLQVLLSQVYRPRALKLLGRFLRFGSWAVNLVLEVGIFPYILKLLQSSIKELRPHLTLLWTKILAVDPKCKGDLVRENGSRYFASIFKDPYASVENRTMSGFVVCSLAPDYEEGISVSRSLLPTSTALECATDEHASLRQWATIVAAHTWNLNPKVRWEATRDNAPEKMTLLLDDSVPEVRAAAAYALGTFIRSLPMSDRYQHGRLINHKIAVSLKNKIIEEASPLVRKELLVALHFLVIMYESSFKDVARQFFSNNEPLIDSPSRQSPRNRTTSQHSGTSPVTVASEAMSLLSPHGIRKSNSYFGISSLSHEHLYMKVWQAIMFLENDPYPSVAELANELIYHVRNVLLSPSNEMTKNSSMASMADAYQEEEATQSSLKNYPLLNEAISHPNYPPVRRSSFPSPSPQSHHSEEDETFVSQVISTDFFDWCANVYRKPGEPKLNDASDGLATMFDNHGSIYGKTSEVKHLSRGQKLDDQKFIGRTSQAAENLLFHPNLPLLITADQYDISIWDINNYETGGRVNWFSNNEVGQSRVTSMTILNDLCPSSYLCVASSDGSIRVWKDSFKAFGGFQPLQRSPILRRDNPPLVSAFYALDEIPSNKQHHKVLMSWEQQTTTLIVGGNSDKIRLWDLTQEAKIRDISTKMSRVTSLHSVSGEPWVAAGFSDGHVRLYDRRNPSPVVREWKDHSSPIISTELFNVSSTSAHIICGAISGEVRLCDLRRAGSMQVAQPNQEILCMSCYPKAHLYAVGTTNQQISIYHTSGDFINGLRSFNGLIGQKIGTVQCLAFHPRQVLMAAGAKEGTVSIFGLTKR